MCVCVCMCVCTLDQDWDGRYSDLLRASSLSCCSSYKECVYFFSSISPANSFSNKVAESFCNWFHPFCCRWSKLGLLVLISSLPELFSGEQVVSFFLFSITLVQGAFHSVALFPLFWILVSKGFVIIKWNFHFTSFLSLLLVDFRKKTAAQRFLHIQPEMLAWCLKSLTLFMYQALSLINIKL